MTKLHKGGGGFSPDGKENHPTPRRHGDVAAAKNSKNNKTDNSSSNNNNNNNSNDNKGNTRVSKNKYFGDVSGIHDNDQSILEGVLNEEQEGVMGEAVDRMRNAIFNLSFILQ